MAMVDFEPNDIFMYWVVVGLLLMLAEAGLPGGVAFALGLAAVATGSITWAGVVESWTAFLGTWAVLSGAIVAVAVPVVHRYFGGERMRAVLDDDAHASGTEVDVVQDVAADHSNGKIRYQGSLWSARSKLGTLPAGSRAKLVYRDGFVWVVELVSLPESNDAL